jgi:hypothetical protein
VAGASFTGIGNGLFLLYLLSLLIVPAFLVYMVWERFSKKPQPVSSNLAAGLTLAVGAVVFSIISLSQHQRAFYVYPVTFFVLVEVLIFGAGLMCALSVNCLISFCRKRPEYIRSLFFLSTHIEMKNRPSTSRATIIQMLSQEKLTPSEAEMLLTALEEDKSPADILPFSVYELGTIIGGILVVVGFVLPWSFIGMSTMFGTEHGHQAGYHVGLLGWMVLLLGLLPAILICLPKLNHIIRQGIFRVLVSLVGFALTGSIALKTPVNIGLWVCASGFLFQLLCSGIEALLMQRFRKDLLPSSASGSPGLE